MSARQDDDPVDDRTTARFTADEASADEQEDFVVAGVARRDSSAYLLFQRSLPIGGDDDWGVYVELDDQISSGYEKIRRCSLRRSVLRVDLAEPIDREGRTACEVDLRIDDMEWHRLADGLRAVFQGHEELLSIENP